MNSLTVGSDAEIPVQLLTGEFIPVTGLVGGTKAEPKPLAKLAKGFFVQEDGPNLEFNIPPAKSPLGFTANINTAVKACAELLPASIVLAHGTSYYKLNAKFFRAIKSLRQMGCEPDYNCWTEEENPRPEDDGIHRVAGAHVHVGWDNPNNEDRLHLVKCLDLTASYRYHQFESLERKKMYGKCGAFRPKRYGVEYRSLGNWWLSDNYGQHIFAAVQNAVILVNQKFTFSKEEGDALQKYVNNGTVDRAAQKLLEAMYYRAGNLMAY
jgi:hypothetical protein